MTPAQQALASAADQCDRLKKVLRKGSTKQVQSNDEIQTAKATAHAWFNNLRPVVLAAVGDGHIKNLDDQYRSLIAASERATLRSKYLVIIKQARTLLSQVQVDQALALAGDHARPEHATTDDQPDFRPLVLDAKMQTILGNRWQECVKCVAAGAPLSAVVMMGGMLEGLLLARVNQLKDKGPVFKATGAPKDKTGTPLKLNEWTLKNYLDVAHELTWITKTTKDVGEVVRDYRNYIHPQKEYSHGVSISADDARTLWEIAKSVARQVLKP
ncbi:MAG: hypothetical protein ABSB88_00695 [Bryobacteraceae bacterium]